MAAPAHLASESSILDLSACLTLEVLSIEDHAHTGLPHQLRRYKRQEGEVDIVPFDRDEGIRFPSRLKAFELIGLTADRFNLGWLKHTPQMNYVNIIGVRFLPALHKDSPDRPNSDRPKVDTLDNSVPISNSSSITSNCCANLPSSMWQLTDVQNHSLRHLQIHHHPTRHFRFKMLRNIPGLESLDLRDVPVDAIREAAEENDVDEGPTIEMSPKRFVVIFRLEIVGVTEATVESTALQLKTVLERYLPDVVKLHVDGLPVKNQVQWKRTNMCKIMSKIKGKSKEKNKGRSKDKNKGRRRGKSRQRSENKNEGPMALSICIN
ncbi:hypothetical protein EC968_008245 [Mortierella alpina]|nr:hypothetical protein EC968_008245 [Mortierella alpina]